MDLRARQAAKRCAALRAGRVARHGHGGQPVAVPPVLVGSILTGISHPDFLNFKLFGQTILVVNHELRLFLTNPLRK